MCPESNLCLTALCLSIIPCVIIPVFSVFPLPVHLDCEVN
jgi:hypothetical protein